jgi:hypothetical protein
MKKYFTPARRLRHDDIYEYSNVNFERSPFEFTEEQLAVPVEAFMNQSWDKSDFLTFMTANALPKIGLDRKEHLSFDRHCQSYFGF